MRQGWLSRGRSIVSMMDGDLDGMKGKEEDSAADLLWGRVVSDSRQQNIMQGGTNRKYRTYGMKRERERQKTEFRAAGANQAAAQMRPLTSY